jgi:hypothetical protein
MLLASAPSHAVSGPVNFFTDSKETYKSSDHNAYATSEEQTHYQIFIKSNAFIRGIETKLNAVNDVQELNALKDVISLISREGVTPFQKFLMKNGGYLTRLFSNENWQDWTQYRNPMDRVVKTYCDYMNTSYAASFMYQCIRCKCIED